MDLKVEAVVVPVSDVDRAKESYKRVGFREDIDYVGAEHFRVVQLTPLGSTASIGSGGGTTDAAPGSARGIHLVVDLLKRDAAVAQGRHRAEIGYADGECPAWYAGFMARVTGLGY